MKLIPKGSNKLVKVGKSIGITNKLITEIDSRKVAISDDFRVSIPDVNFQRVLEFNYNVMVNKGEVSYGDVKGITEIVCINREIESLKGIEYFTALIELVCLDNQLTNLDVTQNTALNELNCLGNELINLDVTKNTALTVLSCRGNQLTNLDVTKNSELYHLGCSNNQLANLDVSQNTALTELICIDNQLTNLDVSQNTALTDLYCSGNQLANLDVSQNTALTGLGCSKNQLTNLDLSNNLNLKTANLKGNPGTWWKELEKDEE